MIWEADETISGSIDYDDLKVFGPITRILATLYQLLDCFPPCFLIKKLCFQRNISDRTGLEPSKLYNLVSTISMIFILLDVQFPKVSVIPHLTRPSSFHGHFRFSS